MYSKILWDHCRNPVNRGVLVDATASAESRYPPCGDRLRLLIRVEDETIRDVRFDAQACGPVIGLASLVTQHLTGRSISEATRLTAFDLDQLAGGLPPAKRHAILMVLDCLHSALEFNTSKGDF